MSDSKHIPSIFYSADSSDWEKVDDYIDRQIVGYNEKVMMVNVRFKKGGIGYMHHHAHVQLTHIAKGEFEVTIGNEKKILKEGDSFYVPSDVEHGVVCLDDGLLVDVFSPMREDFINKKNKN